MTDEQKKKFIDGMVTHAEKLNGACPSDFGLVDYSGDKCKYTNCHKCMKEACEKFFKENGL
jgi:hypothetical protein